MHFNVGTFNLFNLVLPETLYYEDRQYSTEEFQKKTEWIRHQIEAMDSNIIGFQEIFHKDALYKTLEGTAFKKSHIFIPGDNGPDPMVGLATTFELDGEAISIPQIPSHILEKIPDETNIEGRFSRPILKARLRLTDSISMTVFVCHLKSKRPIFLDSEDESDFFTRSLGEIRALRRRAVEACALRHLISEEMINNDQPLIVLGDFNDTTHSVTTDLIMGPTPLKYFPIEQKQTYWDRALYSAADIVSQKSYRKEWFSHIHHGRLDLLDHILVSQEFFHRNPKRIGNVKNLRCLTDHLRDNTLTRERVPIWKSDHAQVVATLSIKRHLVEGDDKE